MEMIFHDHEPPAIQKPKNMLGYALECAYGKAPPASTPFLLPSDLSLTAKGEAVLSAISRGDLSAEQGSKLVHALAGQARLVEIEKLERRIAALEGEAHAKS